MHNPEYVCSRRTIHTERHESSNVASSLDCSLREKAKNYVLSFVISNVDRLDVVFMNATNF